MNLIRKYIKICKTKNPVVPEELTDYVVGEFLKYFSIEIYELTNGHN